MKHILSLTLFTMTLLSAHSHAQSCDRKKYVPCSGDTVFAYDNRAEVIGVIPNRDPRLVQVSVRITEQTKDYIPVGTVWTLHPDVLTIGYPGFCAGDLGTAENSVGPIVGLNIVTKRVTMRVQANRRVPSMVGEYVTYSIAAVSSQGCLDPYR